jgi:hypothetical protein
MKRVQLFRSLHHIIHHRILHFNESTAVNCWKFNLEFKKKLNSMLRLVSFLCYKKTQCVTNRIMPGLIFVAFFLRLKNLYLFVEREIRKYDSVQKFD